MPLYEYQCKSCDAVFEVRMRWSEADRLPRCPNCQSEDTRKKITTFASLGGTSSAGQSSAASSCGSRGGFS